MFPRIIVDREKFRNNLNKLVKMAHAKGITVSAVTKVFCADKELVKIIDESEADFIADSRIKNLERCKEFKKPKMLIRIAMPSEVDKVVEYADISLQSEITTIKLLGEAARKAGKNHKVVLMIDLGDLREGVFFENEQLIFQACDAVMNEENLELYGIGTNLTCYGAILPSKENLGKLIEIANKIREKYNIELPLVSGGNSSSLTMLREGTIPDGITNLRLGESVVLGQDTAACETIEGLYDDAVILEAQIVEMKIKPSMPIGNTGVNAFGEEVSFVDKGMMLRAILAIGRQDMDIDGLTCLDEKIDILGASSDHLLIDLTATKSYNIGDTVCFKMTYGAVLKGFTSEYVYKTYIN